jgi:hypothetical protein
MEYALIKRYIARSSAPYLPRLTRASVHGKPESQPKGNDERTAAVFIQPVAQRLTYFISGERRCLIPG